jgi:uncharacterized protein YoxC
MDNHQLSERIAGLASRVNNLAINTSGESSRLLLEQQNELIDLAQLAIVQDLDARVPNYKAALSKLNDAIRFIGDASKKIQKVTDAIKYVSGAIKAVTKLLKP